MADHLMQVHMHLFNLLDLPIPIVTATGSLVLFISVFTNIWNSSKIFEDLIRNPTSLASLLFGGRSAVTYDFIIVGGGSAGLVIANRLTENGKFTVLILEVGGDPNPINAIPELAPYNLHHKPTDWGYQTVPQDNACLSMFNKQLAWPRGKVLGGCSSLNWMIYQRGCDKEYAEWARVTKDEQWNYSSLLPYFKKSQNYHGWFPNPTFHGTGGYLDVSQQNYLPSLEQWIAGGKEMGFDTETDPNSYQIPGFYPMDVTINEGQRESTFRAFLQPVLNRNNLVVSRYSRVIKLNVDDTLTATGVTYIKNGRTLTVQARNEVILSAGAIGTPHLLMLSGIGNSSHLQSVGITPTLDLPGVGQNLQDHVLTLFGPFLLNTSISFLTDRDLTYQTMVDYARNGTGPFSFNDLSGIGFIATSQSSDPTWANIEFHQSPVGMRKTVADDFTVVFGLDPGILQELYHPYIGLDSNFVMVDLGRPKSFGEIRLSSKDPFVHPLIDPKYYSDPSDMGAMIEALQFLLKMYEETQTWQKVGATFAPGKLRGCESHEWKSVAYLECYIRHLTFTIYHPCGTAKMGAEEDPLAVVDSFLKLRGIHKLRIADASVIPITTNANLNAPTIVIAEKAADFILKEWT